MNRAVIYFQDQLWDHWTSLLKGFGGVKSSNEAVRHFEMGCEHGINVLVAKWQTSIMKGNLVKQDTTQALRLYKQSCELFNAEACLKVGN